jgi:hypothetical protein
LVNEITEKYRDIAVHRMPPCVMAVDPKIFPNNSSKVWDAKVFEHPGDPERVFDRLLVDTSSDEAQRDSEIIIGDPTDYHNKWRTHFLDFCAVICEDIKKANFSTGCIE